MLPVVHPALAFQKPYEAWLRNLEKSTRNFPVVNFQPALRKGMNKFVVPMEKTGTGY